MGVVVGIDELHVGGEFAIDGAGEADSVQIRNYPSILV